MWAMIKALVAMLVIMYCLIHHSVTKDPGYQISAGLNNYCNQSQENRDQMWYNLSYQTEHLLSIRCKK